jgi:photosystem II stability/assembly factor-like uncharacterized protein
MPRLYAATGSGIGVLAVEDGLATVTTALNGSGAQCLAADPHDPESVYAGCRGSGVYRSRDGGRSWDDLRLPVADVFSVAVSAADGAVYAGCEPSMLFVSRDEGRSWRELVALRELPSAPTWSFPPRPWTSHVRWIAPSPHEASLLLAGIELGGLMRSEDGGATWADHRPGAQRDVHALAWHPRVRERAYEAGGGGATWSNDGGRTWQAADQGRDRHYTWALAVDPEDPDCWYVSATYGPYDAHTDRPARARIYRSRGGPWEPLAGGLPDPLDSMPYALTHGGARLYAGLRDGRLLASDGGGDRWSELELRGDRLTSVLALASAA